MIRITIKKARYFILSSCMTSWIKKITGIWIETKIVKLGLELDFKKKIPALTWMETKINR